LGGIAASDFLKMAQQPSGEPYWKIRQKGGCEDIMLITIHDKLPGIVKRMNKTATKAGYNTTEIGVYIQPLVQGSNIHAEFNLFYDPANQKEAARVRGLAVDSIDPLMSKGAFFSRPYGEGTNIIMNKDAATVETLRKVKSILDPDNIMNPGKLCF